MHNKTIKELEADIASFESALKVPDVSPSRAAWYRQGIELARAEIKKKANEAQASQIVEAQVFQSAKAHKTVHTAPSPPEPQPLAEKPAHPEIDTENNAVSCPPAPDLVQHDAPLSDKPAEPAPFSTTSLISLPSRADLQNAPQKIKIKWSEAEIEVVTLGEAYSLFTSRFRDASQLKDLIEDRPEMARQKKSYKRCYGYYYVLCQIRNPEGLTARELKFGRPSEIDRRLFAMLVSDYQADRRKQIKKIPAQQKTIE